MGLFRASKMGKKSTVFQQYLEKGMEIQNQDTMYSTIEDSVWAVGEGASDFGPPSRYNIVRSVHISTSQPVTVQNKNLFSPLVSKLRFLPSSSSFLVNFAAKKKCARMRKNIDEWVEPALERDES